MMDPNSILQACSRLATSNDNLPSLAFAEEIASYDGAVSTSKQAVFSILY